MSRLIAFKPQLFWRSALPIMRERALLARPALVLGMG
jgi:hypothetical protein